MRRICLALMLCFFPLVAAAQDKLPRIDWTIVFAERADRLETKILEGGEVVRELALPNSVVVQERQSDEGPKYETRQTDGSFASRVGGGPAACNLFYYIFYTVSLEQCPEQRDTEQTREIGKRLERIARFVGENSVPPITDDALARALLRNKTEMRNRISKPSKSICEYLGGEPSDVYSGERMGEFLSELLSVPQLPVGGNCL